jgi:hypothetical protein
LFRYRVQKAWKVVGNWLIFKEGEVVSALQGSTYDARIQIFKISYLEGTVKSKVLYSLLV